MEDKENWFKDFNSEVGKRISKAWFITFSNSKGITDFVYGNEIDHQNWKVIKKKKIKKDTINGAVKTRFTKWKRLGFFEVSRNLKIKTWRRGNWYYPTTKLYMLNLNPLYNYCEEKNINFSPEEKEFLNGVNGLLRPNQVRELIFFEYPEEDLITAILKFYVKHYIMLYGYLTRLQENPINKEMKEKFEEAKLRAEEIEKNKDKWKLNYTRKQQRASEEFYKREGFNDKEAKRMAEQMKEILRKVNKSTKNEKYDYIDVLSHEEITRDNFIRYVSENKKNPKLVLNVDKNIMKALGILPS